MYSLSYLSSGLRLLTAPSVGTAALTVTVFVGAGSRYERESERGISHFLEHMFFKGGRKYTSTKDVSSAIDGIGGEFNAYTGKEYAGYYVKIAAEHLTLACDVLSDMLLHAQFPPAEIEKERGVIIEEERMYQDTPMYRAGWDFEQLLFGNHPLGWDTIGKEEVIRSVQQRDFQEHQRRLYTTDNTVLVFAGNITEDLACEHAQRFFAPLQGQKKNGFLPFSSYADERVFLRTKKTEQSHIVLGFPGVSALDPDHFAHKLLAIILGGNMSSRMFLSVREARGLCYYISTETDSYLDAGSLSTRAGVDPSRLEEAIKAIIHEYTLCAKKGVSDSELIRAKSYLKGRTLLALEDSEERGHFYGKQELLYPKTYDIPEYLTFIDSVTREQLNTLANRLLQPGLLRIALIGNEERKGHILDLLRNSWC